MIFCMPFAVFVQRPVSPVLFHFIDAPFFHSSNRLLLLLRSHSRTHTLIALNQMIPTYPLYYNKYIQSVCVCVCACDHRRFVCTAFSVDFFLFISRKFIYLLESAIFFRAVRVKFLLLVSSFHCGLRR